jgi:hypothetical protein
MWCVLPLTILGVLAYLLPLMIFAQGMFWDDLIPVVTNRDFVNYWMAGRMTLSGEYLDLFFQPFYFAQLQEMFGVDYPIHNWSYPPHFLLLLWPFGLLGYKLSMIVFLGSTFALFLFSVVVFRNRYASDSNRAILMLALTSYAMMMVDTAQNGFLTSALLLLGFAWMGSRPALSGLAFGLLTIKPQLGLLVPLLLLLDRNWRTIAWASAWSVVLVVLSAVLFGWQSWFAYATETVQYQQFVMTGWTGVFLPMMPTAFGSMRTLGLTPEIAQLVQWPVSVLSAALVVWLLWKDRDPLRRVFALTCGTFLVSPYGFNYDMGALAVIAACLVGSNRVTSNRALIALSVVAALPAAVMNLGRTGIPVAPLLLAAALLALAACVHRDVRSAKHSVPARPSGGAPIMAEMASRVMVERR